MFKLLKLFSSMILLNIFWYHSLWSVSYPPLGVTWYMPSGCNNIILNNILAVCVSITSILSIRSLISVNLLKSEFLLYSANGSCNHLIGDRFTISSE